MLDVSTYQAPSAIVKQPTTPVINGPGHRALKRLTKSQRAAYAVAVLRGEVGLQPTLNVVAAAVGVSITYIGYALKLSSGELRLVRLGKLTLADLKPAAAAPEPAKAELTVEDIADWWWSAPDVDRAAVIGRVGVAPVWDALAKNLV